MFQAHLLQLWVRPNQKNLKPNYQTQKFDAFEKDNKLCLFVGPENADPERKAITINQDMFVSAVSSVALSASVALCDRCVVGTVLLQLAQQRVQHHPHRETCAPALLCLCLSQYCLRVPCGVVSPVVSSVVQPVVRRTCTW